MVWCLRVRQIGKTTSNLCRDEWPLLANCIHSCSLQHETQRTDCVEKLRILDAAIFRKEPLMPKSQMRSVMRRSELAHERQKTNLAEPLVSKSWLRCTDKNFADLAKNGIFQHNRLTAGLRLLLISTTSLQRAAGLVRRSKLTYPAQPTLVPHRRF